MKKVIAFISIVCISGYVFSSVRLPKVFGDNMVLQRNKPISVWGWAAANEKVTIEFNKQLISTGADKYGRWAAVLNPEIAGGPFRLIVTGKNTIIINNVLVGEVWICSGQSNMELPVAGWGKINNYQQEIKNADYSQIRQFEVPKTINTEMQDDVNGGSWKICSPATVGDFSATAYFFARQLYNQLKVPIGLINSSWGGTQIETWISQKSLEQSDEFKKIADSANVLSLQSIKKKRRELMMKKIEFLHGNSFTISTTGKWKDIDYDDNQWLPLKEPGEWEEQGFPDLDGIAWLRKTIILNEIDTALPALIELAKIDDRDETLVNGIKVGSNNNWDDNRKYIIPAGVLKAGKNVIAVKVYDDGGSGGIYGDEEDMKLTVENKVISLAGIWKFNIESVSKADTIVTPNDYPCLLFNTMIHPFIHYTIQGAIWYQGESNTQRASQYKKSFPLMIKDWRQHFNQGDFPFLFVQLTSYSANRGNSNKGSTWAELREAQTTSLLLPNTGMAVTTDIGDAKDLHPKNKQDVGKRLASIALHDVYNVDGEYTGPVYQSMKVDGNKIILSFTHISEGWIVKDKYGYIKGFEIAGADQKFVFAKAMIDGDKIIVYQENIAQPVAVRYAWADDVSEANLFNNKMYPAAPFRTDNWREITDGIKYQLIE